MPIMLDTFKHFTGLKLHQWTCMLRRIEIRLIFQSVSWKVCMKKTGRFIWKIDTVGENIIGATQKMKQLMNWYFKIPKCLYYTYFVQDKCLEGIIFVQLSEMEERVRAIIYKNM